MLGKTVVKTTGAQFCPMSAFNTTGRETSACNVSTRQDSPSESSDEEGLHSAYYVFIFAQLLGGIGKSGLTTLGLAYIDENAPKSKSSMYIGTSVDKRDIIAVIITGSPARLSRVNGVRRSSAETWNFNPSPIAQFYINWFQIWRGWLRSGSHQPWQSWFGSDERSRRHVGSTYTGTVTFLDSSTKLHPIPVNQF